MRLSAVRNLWVALIPASIILTSAFITFSSLINQHPELAMAITYDLTLVSPILYLVAIWKKNIPKITAIPVFVIGMLVSKVILSGHDQTHVDFIIDYIFPLVELAVMGVIIFFVRKTIKEFKKQKNTSIDFYHTLKPVAYNILKKPRLAELFATEISMIAYALFIWKRNDVKENQYTMHDLSTAGSIYVGFLLLVIIESIPLHLLIEQWSPLIAWIVTISSAYAFLQILGQLKALSRRYHEIGENKLMLRSGLFAEVEIDFTQIESVELTETDVDDLDIPVKKLGMLGKLEGHNVLIHLKEEVEIRKLYGLKAKANNLLIWVDKKNEFKQKLDENLGETTK